MSAIYHLAPPPVNTEDILGTPRIAGQKRSFTPQSNDSFEIGYHSPKRTSPYYYAYLTDNPEASPKTPESGIDMSDHLGCSPPCYSVTRTSTSHMYDGAPTTDLPTSVQLEPQPDQFKDGFYLVIVDEPEENYRARYDSEGCRGPMKGRNGGCPTIELMSKQPWSSADIKVELVAADKSPLNSCKLDSTEDGANLRKKAHPRERVSFENLRIRRLKKGDVSNRTAVTIKQQQSKQTLKGTRGKQDEKVAYLLFTARVRNLYNNNDVELKVLSQPIHLNACHDPPEIHCVVPQCASSGEPVAIIGTRMHSPRVAFIVRVDGKEQEIPADINKDVSHQNALVIKVPILPASAYCNSNVANVHICITAGKGDRSGKEPLKSNPCPFYCVQPSVCKECAVHHNQTNFGMYRSVNNGHPTPSSPPMMLAPPLPVNKTNLLNTSRSNKVALTSSPIVKPISPRPPPRSPSCTSPPLSVVAPSPNYHTPPYTVNQPLQSSPHITTIQARVGQQQQSHQSSDVVNEILSLCPPSTASVDCPLTPSQASSSPACYGVVPSEPLIDGIGFSDTHSGPVSPDEFNCYLPNTNPVVSSGAFNGLRSCSTQQDYANIYNCSSSIGVVQPTSLGQFSQKP